MEKSFGHRGGESDGGTSARVFGSLLSWLQERTAPVFVIATTNDVSQLPPELLRKGRLDETFFVDLPNDGERDAIWRIHIARRGRDAGGFVIHAVVHLSEGFTGSEIEQTVTDALCDCFDQGKELDTEAIARAIDGTVPLSITMAEQIKKLRQWANNRARRASCRSNSDGGRRIAA